MTMPTPSSAASATTRRQPRAYLISAAATLTAALALTGCAGRSDTGARASAIPTTSPSAACPSTPVTVSDQDNGHVLCVQSGQTIDVVLHGTADQRWSAIESSDQAVRIRATGRGTLPVGVTAGFFTADHSGTAVLTSSRPACGPTPAAGASCHSLVSFRITITVR